MGPLQCAHTLRIRNIQIYSGITVTLVACNFDGFALDVNVSPHFPCMSCRPAVASCKDNTSARCICTSVVRV